MNFSGYVGHVTIFSSRVRVRIRVMIRFSVWLVSCYAYVFVLCSIVTVTLRAQLLCAYFHHSLVKNGTDTLRNKCIVILAEVRALEDAV